MWTCLPVALLAEGVDRNTATGAQPIPALRSPSSRRAWIEIGGNVTIDAQQYVALLAEGVDRNFKLLCTVEDKLRRPPRGGRG